MPFKVVSAILIRCLHNRFGNIVKQHRQTQNLIRLHIEKAVKDMLSDRKAMIRRILLRLHTEIKLRQKFLRDPCLIRSSQIIRMRRNQKLHKLRLNPLCTDILKV